MTNETRTYRLVVTLPSVTGEEAKGIAESIEQYARGFESEESSDITVGHLVETPLTHDRAIIDRIANLLAAPEWSGADFLEIIADLIGTVRPHPGGHETRNEYRTKFEAVTGRDAIEGDDEE